MKPPEITVTDHAIIRYLERVRGIDLTFVREEISRIVAGTVVMGGSKVSNGGFTYCLRGNHVTTILPGSSPQASYRLAERHKGHGNGRMPRIDGRRPSP